jgi:chloramphenicol-sensitive protein RarD
VPIYWKWLGGVAATELIAHRILWSLIFLLGVQALRRRLQLQSAAWRDPVARRSHLLSGLLLTANWLIYIWGVQQDQVIECSLGYFLVPLLNAALGRIVLKERLRRVQQVALGLAAAGVLILVLQVGRVPWIALSLAGTFGFYGLIRKRSGLGPMTGLSLETAMMLPLALAYLAWAAGRCSLAFGAVDATTTALIISTGVVTTIPLLLFARGARSLRFTTLGLLQYVAPTCQFLIGWLVYHEAFTRDQAWAFGLIWLGLACYSYDAWQTGRAARSAR